MRIHFCALLLVFAPLMMTAQVQAESSVSWHEHEFKEGDTLWFLAQIYYGDGSKFQKLLEVNDLKSAQAVRDGQKIMIPSPLYTPDQPGFGARLSHLREQRAQNLAKRLVASEEPSAKPKAKPSKKRDKASVEKIESKEEKHEETVKPAAKPKKNEPSSFFSWPALKRFFSSPLDERAKAELGGK